MSMSPSAVGKLTIQVLSKHRISHDKTNAKLYSESILYGTHLEPRLHYKWLCFLHVSFIVEYTIRTSSQPYTSHIGHTQRIVILSI